MNRDGEGEKWGVHAHLGSFQGTETKPAEGQRIAVDFKRFAGCQLNCRQNEHVNRFIDTEKKQTVNR